MVDAEMNGRLILSCIHAASLSVLCKNSSVGPVRVRGPGAYEQQIGISGSIHRPMKKSAYCTEHRKSSENAPADENIPPLAEQNTAGGSL